ISVVGENDPATERSTTLSLQREEYEVAFRLPNSSDLAAIHSSDGHTAPKQALLERIVTRALCRSQPVNPADLPEQVVEAIENVMVNADPHAEIWLDLICAACGRHWQALFDVVSFVWSEVDAWAIRLLREVHRLARAYSWREADILSMSPIR